MSFLIGRFGFDLEGISMEKSNPKFFQFPFVWFFFLYKRVF